jgi:hypothetical protein
MTFIASYLLRPTPQHRQPSGTKPGSKSRHPATARRKMLQRTRGCAVTIKKRLRFRQQFIQRNCGLRSMNRDFPTRFLRLHVGLLLVWHTACTKGLLSGHNAPAKQPFPTSRWGLWLFRVCGRLAPDPHARRWDAPTRSEAPLSFFGGQRPLFLRPSSGWTLDSWRASALGFGARNGKTVTARGGGQGGVPA